jgi:hypothetical protein
VAIRVSGEAEPLRDIENKKKEEEYKNKMRP